MFVGDFFLLIHVQAKIMRALNSQDQKLTDQVSEMEIENQIICRHLCIFQPCDMVRHFPGHAFSVTPKLCLAIT